MKTIDHQQLEKYVAEAKGRFEHLLGDLIEIPTISMDRAHSQDMRRGAELAASYLQGIGAKTEVIETNGHPLVLGYAQIDPSAPTVTLYHHLDVQPATPSVWASHPFHLTIKDNYYYFGRGATDNKGPAITALMAAQFAIEQNFPLNLRFIWEMEEEIGSPNFASAIQAKKEEFTTDSIIVSDTNWISRDKPAIPHGLRGLMTASLTLTTGEKDAHSGITGGAARNPLGELCNLICRCYDPTTGLVAIPGFYDTVKKPSADELEEYAKAGFEVHEFQRIHGFRSLRFQDSLKLLQAIWCEPTFEVHGLVGGYQGEGIKTIVPHTAQAKISTRLVPYQKPEEIFQLLKAFVVKENPEVEVSLEAILNPYLADFSGPFAQAAREALYEGFSQSPVFIREGGSIGPVVTMQKTWGVPIILLGFSLPEHACHAPNEYFDWHQAEGGIKTLVHYFQKISQFRPD